MNEGPFRKSRGNAQAKTLRRCCRLQFMDISILDVIVRAGGHSVGGDADLQ